MITKENTFSISQLRREAGQIIKKVQESNEPFYIFRRSEPQAVIMDIDRYNMTQEILEDYLDALELDNAQNEPTTSLAKYKEQRWGKSSR